MSKSMLFLYTESPLHAGSGRALGTVDLPIQRERVTRYPMIQSGGVKGRLRAEMETTKKLTQDELWTLFGPDTNNASDNAGALSCGDARLLLFPVRSLAGVFAWVTSVDVLARFRRELASLDASPEWAVPHTEPGETEAWVNGQVILAGGKVVLEEFSFTPVENETVKKIGNWLAKNALPQGDEYAYWRSALPQNLCILHRDAFRDFVLYATEVQTHIKLDPDKKTVESGALWTSESLPVDSLLYVPIVASQPRRNGTEMKTDADVLKKLTSALPGRINFGGDETTGQGFVALKVWGGA
jgi:CRISPR-associated protein Cmr4